MRKLSLIALCLILFSCSKEGEIKHQSVGSIKINGKEYKFIEVVPADGQHGVWLLVPVDARIEIPQVTSHQISCGKNCKRNLTAIFVKS